MKKREYRDYLNDIVECIDDVKSFITSRIQIMQKYIAKPAKASWARPESQ